MTVRFGTDGVRGLANVELTPELALALGRVGARVLGSDRPFVVGRDTRRSGPMLQAALAAGLTAEGADVDLVDVLPTPGVAYLAESGDCPGAVVSASHNPFPDNGIKFFARGGRKLADKLEARIEAELDILVGEERRAGPAGAGIGVVRVLNDARQRYCDHLRSAVPDLSLDGLRVVIDCGNGAASYLPFPVLLEKAIVDVRNVTPDGTNINDGCGAAHPQALRAAVPARGGHIGLAFDGDADRMMAVDEKGRLVDGDHFLAIAALDLRDRGRLPHNAVVSTVMANLGFRKAMAHHGIRVVETKVGDRYVLEAMEAEGIVLGGEQSGHVIFADLATTGDGVLSGLVLLDIMSRAGRPLSELASVVTKFPQVLRNVTVSDRSGLDGAERFWEEVRSVEAELGAAGRVLVRASGTEPVVRIMVEAGSADVADAYAGRLEAALTGALGPG